MNSKPLLILSLAVNVLLLGALAMLSNALSVEPKPTTPLVKIVFTNGPAAPLDSAAREQLLQWQTEMEAESSQ